MPESFPQKSPEGAESKESKKMFDSRKALEEEDGVLRRLVSMGGGKVKKGIATLMLGSALVLGAGAFRGNAEVEVGGKGTIEATGLPKSAEALVNGLTKHAKEEKNLQDYASNKRAAIDEVKAYVLSRQGQERKKALSDVAAEFANPAVQKSPGLRDGMKYIIDVLRHTQ